MTSDKILNKQIIKKWWFWVIVIVVLGVVGLLTQDTTTTTTNTATDTPESNTGNTQTVGKLPTLNKADFVDKEGLVVFKDLSAKGYTVTAKYENEKVPATNQDHTEQFASADANSCSDRLGWDAYVVSDIRQDGDSVAVITTNKPTSSQTCPAGTTDDR